MGIQTFTATLHPYTEVHENVTTKHLFHSSYNASPRIMAHNHATVPSNALKGRVNRSKPPDMTIACMVTQGSREIA